jgi:hypothetical protein
MTNSSDFPTTPGAYDRSFNGDYDVFVAKLTADGSSLLYSTFLGGKALESAAGIAVDAAGAAFVTGDTYSSDFPTTPGAYDTNFSGGYPGPSDSFVAKLSADGSILLYSTFLGGGLGEWATAITVDTTGAALVTGVTTSPDFPTTPGAYDTSFNGADGYVTKLTMACDVGSWTNYGSGWPGTDGIPSFTSSGDPTICAAFTLNLDNSLGANTTAALFLGLVKKD